MLELLIILIIGVFLIYIAYKSSEKKCPHPRVEFRFIPRTLHEEMENPVKVSEIFSDMFANPNVYTGKNLDNKNKA